MLKMKTQPMSPSMIDQLEPRQLLAADGRLRVENVQADNRGRVVITLDENAKNINKNNVRVFTKGPDDILGNGNDTRITSATVSYNPSNFKITIKTQTDRDQAFRIRLEDEIRSVSGSNKLDGEFNGGSTLSGNGTHGGDFKFKAARDTGTNQFVRMDTTFGAIKIKVRKDAAPISAGKFLDLVNTGKYDNIFVTRAIEDFVVQLGSMQIKGDGNDAHDLDENTAPEFGQELPRNLSNVRGTMSFARGGAQNNGSNQFFFNLASNTFLDTAQGNSPVFTPFAEVTSGMSVVDAMSTATKVALVNSFGTGPAGILQDDQENDLIQATGLSDVPVQTTTGLTISNVQTQSGTVKVVTGDFQPKHKLVIINRTAIQMVVTAST